MRWIPLTPEQVKDHRQRIDDAQRGIHLLEPPIDGDRMQQRLAEAERKLASPTTALKDYELGVANHADEVYTTPGTGAVVSTEHATTHRRRDRRSGKVSLKLAEPGLAAIGHVLAENRGIAHTTLLGRQRGDANHDSHHPFKQHLFGLLASSRAKVFLSLHGMQAGHVADLDDERVFDVVVGVGKKPSQATQTLAARIVASAASLGLRAGINQPLLRIVDHDGQLYWRAHEDGTTKPVIFAGSLATTTRSSVEDYAGSGIASVQVEIADPLRLAVDELTSRSERVIALGPVIGALMLDQSLAATSHDT